MRNKEKWANFQARQARFLGKKYKGTALSFCVKIKLFFFLSILVFSFLLNISSTEE